MEDRKLGRFELQRRLGGGGMGEVFLAFDPVRAGLVALKRIPLDSTAPDVLVAEERGASLQQRLHRYVPAVAEVYEFARAQGFFYISMEYVDGLDLSAVLQLEETPERRALGIAVQLCRIVAELQLASQAFTEQLGGVVHGDIKPQNVRLQENDRVRLLDFGVAKSLSISRRFTQNVFGSLPYLSPERLSQGVVDVQADLWAVAVVLYEMVTGQLPFPGATIEALEMRFRQGQPPERPPDDRSSPTLRKVLLRALAIDPAERYPNPKAFLADLEAVLEGRPIAGWTAGAETTRTTLDSSAGKTTPLPEEPARKQEGRPLHRTSFSGRLASFIGTALVVLILGSQGCAFLGARQIRQGMAGRSDPKSLMDLSDRLLQVLPLDVGGFWCSEVRDNLKAALFRSAEPVFSNYRSDLATTPADWEEAALRLEKAVALDEKDDLAAAQLAYSQGQAERLRAEISLAQDPHAARQGWVLAEARLLDAARRAPELPDPYVALADLYGNSRYEPFDVDKLKNAIEEAGRRNFKPGRREHLALVRGYLRTGTVQYELGHEQSNTPEGVSALYAAKKSLTGALEWCERVAGSRSAVEPCAETRGTLGAVEELLTKRHQF